MCTHDRPVYLVQLFNNTAIRMREGLTFIGPSFQIDFLTPEWRKVNRLPAYS
jgi:hypothetical protein